MKKRLRKKLRVGEFREDCFEITFRIDPSITLRDVDELTDNFIAMIEHAGLQFGGGGNYEWSGVVQGPWRGTVTSEDQKAVLEWLRQHNKIVDVLVGPLKDAWHGSK